MTEVIETKLNKNTIIIISENTGYTCVAGTATAKLQSMYQSILGQGAEPRVPPDACVCMLDKSTV